MKLKRFIRYNVAGHIEHSDDPDRCFKRISFYQLRIDAMKILNDAAATAGVTVDQKPHLNEKIGGTI